jgi:hypothetical protein
VDVGYENPIFACIEMDYSDVDQDPTGEAYQNAEKVVLGVDVFENLVYDGKTKV